MPNSITNRQMVFILFLTLTSAIVVNIPKLMAQSAGTGNWITILAASVVFGLAVYIICTLNSMFPGMVLFDYSRELVGKFVSILLSVYFLQYFITVILYLNYFTVNLLNTNFLPNTPAWAELLASLPVFGFVAYKGITNVARLCEIYGIIFLIIAIAVHIIMLFQGHINYILPLFESAETGKCLSAVKDAIITLLGIEVLTIIPFSAKNGKNAPKIAFFTVIGVGLFYILVVESSIMMVGMNEIVYYNYPLVVAIRQVQIPAIKILQRIDILYLTVGFIALFAGTSIVYLAIVEYACRLLPKIERIFIVIAIGAIIFLLGIVISNIEDIDHQLVRILTYSGVIVAIVIPSMLLIIAKVKNHGKKAH